MKTPRKEKIGITLSETIIGPLTYIELVTLMRGLREAMEIKLGELGALAGNINSRTIQRIEKGEKDVRAYHLEQVCKSLGYQLSQEKVYILTPLPNSPLLPQEGE